MARIHIPTLLRHLTNNQHLINIPATTAKAAIFNLVEMYPSLAPYLINEKGHISHFVNVYINNLDIRFISPDEECIAETDSITIIPATAGG